MYITLIEKSSKAFKLSVYDEGLLPIETDSFQDPNTLNFHLQALAKKHRMDKSILVIHDKEKYTVDILLANGEDLFFDS